MRSPRTPAQEQRSRPLSNQPRPEHRETHAHTHHSGNCVDVDGLGIGGVNCGGGDAGGVEREQHLSPGQPACRYIVKPTPMTSAVLLILTVLGRVLVVLLLGVLARISMRPPRPTGLTFNTKKSTLVTTAVLKVLMTVVVMLVVLSETSMYTPPQPIGLALNTVDPTFVTTMAVVTAVSVGFPSRLPPSSLSASSFCYADPRTLHRHPRGFCPAPTNPLSRRYRPHAKRVGWPTRR